MSNHLTIPLALPAGPGPVDMDGHAFATVTDAALAGDFWNAEQLGTVLGWADRIAGPYLLWDAYDGGVIERDAVASHVGQVWSRTEFPDAALGHARWRALFTEAGFTRDGVLAARPTEPVELWRGSVPERRADWSWSTDWETAGHYAMGSFKRPPGRLYRSLVPAAALLCANNGRSESEYVVDTDHPGVVITEA
ncbi:hypothetical protein [Streptomyces parvus]|uniref:hypothetical protein n=1 Tax=Streptomyces parvus TaxID=66428 RepID=UPI003684BC97